MKLRNNDFVPMFQAFYNNFRLSKNALERIKEYTHYR